MAALDGVFLRLVTEVGGDGTAGHYGRCIEGVGIHGRWSGRRVDICG